MSKRGLHAFFAPKGGKPGKSAAADAARTSPRKKAATELHNVKSLGGSSPSGTASSSSSSAAAASSSSPAASAVPPKAPSPAERAEANRLAAKAKLAAKAAAANGEFTMPTLPPCWGEALNAEFEKPYFKRLEAYLATQVRSGKKVFPPREEIFTAFNLTPLDKVRVVVIGQDPYHGAGQGHGLSFSVKHGVQTPPSLRNMVKEAMACEGIPKPSHGNLSNWAEQGVLMLNNVMTVRQGEANSHKNQGWENFTDAVIRHLNRREGPGYVFMLWGKPAHEKGKSINRSKHMVITSSHPSPLGATKTNEPFMGSRCFTRANDALVERGYEKIDWRL